MQGSSAADLSGVVGGGSVVQIAPLTGAFEAGPNGTWASEHRSVSSNGRFVLYQHRAQAGDYVVHTYIRDLDTGAERHVPYFSRRADPLPGALSDDGQFVFFKSSADLTAGETGGRADIYRLDLSSNDLVRVSVLPPNPPSGGIERFVTSPDGNVVVFRLYNASLETDAQYLRDVAAGTTTRIDLDVGGNEIQSFAQGPLSFDGSVMSFQASISYPATTWRRVVQLWDRSTGGIQQISPDLSSENELQGVGAHAMTPDGRYVAMAFKDLARVMVLDREIGTLTDAALTTTGQFPSSGQVWGSVVISPNGRFVAFNSSTDDLVAGDKNSQHDLFVRDLWAERTLRADLRPDGFETAKDDAGYYMAPEPHGIDNNGRVVFSSDARDLSVPLENEYDVDVFVRTFGPETVAPNTEFISGPSGTTAARSVSAAFTSWASQFECRLDSGAWESCTSPVATPDLADGPHTLAVRAVQAELVDPTPTTRSWTVDTTPPDTRIATGPASPGRDNTPTFSFVATESGATHQCKLDTGVWLPCSSPHTTPSLTDGSHTFAIRAADSVGNIDPSPATRTIVIDRVAPDTRVTSAAMTATTDRTPTVRFTSTEAGSTYQCRVDKNPWKSCRSPWTTGRLAKGKHILAMRAADRAGNIDPRPVTRTIIVR